MFTIFFILVLALVATWNAEPVFALADKLDLPPLLESIIILALVGGLPALVVFAGVILDTMASERRRTPGRRKNFWRERR